MPARRSTTSRAPAIADTCYIGPEAEFFIFDDVRFDQNTHEGYYHLDSIEGEWNRGRQENPNLGYKLRYKEGYFPVPPADQMMNIRNEMMQTMIDCGLDVEAQHHEVATAGQSEIDLRFDDLVRMADKMMIYKYIIKNVALKHNKTVTFMPKPLFGDNGSGMHTHISLWKGGNPLFAGSGYAGLSEMAMYAIGGLLRMRRPSWRSRIPRLTATSGWCRATRRRSTWPIRSATVRPVAAYRCIAPAPRPNGSNSAVPTRAATPTWPSRRC